MEANTKLEADVLKLARKVAETLVSEFHDHFLYDCHWWQWASPIGRRYGKLAKCSFELKRTDSVQNLVEQLQRLTRMRGTTKRNK
jgi:hypothetical protein